MKHINDKDEFEDLTATGNVVIQFSATWCGPCKTLTKTMESVVPSHPNTTFYKVDIDNMDRSVLNEYNIRSVPRLIMFVDGKDVAEMIGSKSQSEVDEFINSNKGS